MKNFENLIVFKKNKIYSFALVSWISFKGMICFQTNSGRYYECFKWPPPLSLFICKHDLFVWFGLSMIKTKNNLFLSLDSIFLKRQHTPVDIWMQFDCRCCSHILNIEQINWICLTQSNGNYGKATHNDPKWRKSTLNDIKWRKVTLSDAK